MPHPTPSRRGLRGGRNPAPPSRARYVETLGLILIGLLIFAITLARFARHVSWRWR